MSGIAQTKSIYKKDGRIILSGDPESGTVSVSGKLIATGKNAGEKGGNIDITGYNILLASPSLLDVSGDIGGGNINIGGNYQGKGPLPNANAIAMESGAKMFADAVSSGNGGNIILWSDFFTRAHGSISAQGGAKSGDGGFIETSGKHYLASAAAMVTSSSIPPSLIPAHFHSRSVHFVTSAPHYRTPSLTIAAAVRSRFALIILEQAPEQSA